MPVFQTDYSRAYGMAGGRFAWFFERFAWRAVSYDMHGNVFPQDAADYTNTLSQRMYGPFIGCGNEIFIANQFSLSCDLTGAMLLDVAKERAKYKLGDDSVQSKWGRDEFRVVPNANAAVNLWWYPIDGVQIRVGYQAMTYYNTLYMLEPVGFDFSNINPSYTCGPSGSCTGSTSESASSSRPCRWRDNRPLPTLPDPDRTVSPDESRRGRGVFPLLIAPIAAPRSAGIICPVPGRPFAPA